MFVAQVLVGPSKQLKPIIPTEHNIVKNHNWPEANQSAIYERGQGFDLASVLVRVVLEPGTTGL